MSKTRYCEDCAGTADRADGATGVYLCGRCEARRNNDADLEGRLAALSKCYNEVCDSLVGTEDWGKGLAADVASLTAQNADMNRELASLRSRLGIAAAALERIKKVLTETEAWEIAEEALRLIKEQRS